MSSPRHLRIGLDLTGLWRQKTGIFRYADCLARALIEQPKDGEFTLFIRRGSVPAPWMHTASARLVFTPFRQERLMTQFWFPLARHQLGLDAMHYPAFPGPFLQRSGYVATIQDVTVLRYPQTMTLVARRYWGPSLQHSARVSKPLIVPSQSTRRDVIDLLGADPAHISVTPYAADAVFRQALSPRQLSEVRQRLKLPERFALTVSTLEPRKNLTTLLGALQRLGRVADPPVLVIVGRPGWGSLGVQEQLAALGDRVRLLGHTPDTDLAALYQMATVFAFPTLYEGFGLPVLEAFASGCPVIAANTSSVPEAAGDAAILLDPLNVDAWAGSLQRAWVDAALRQRLSDAGRRQERTFSWARCAELTAQAYRDHIG